MMARLPAVNDGSARSLRVMVVDDDPAVRDAAQELLERAGHTVEVAENGEIAEERLKAAPAPDVLVLDLLMPGRDGVHLLEALRRSPRLSSTRVVIVTGLSGRFLKEALQVDSVLTKPIVPRDLLDSVSPRLASPDL
jgi:CheY-like chemotaxis protein